MTQLARAFVILSGLGVSRIITATLEAVINVIHCGLDPRPRSMRKQQEAQGYPLEEQKPWWAAELVAVGRPFRTKILRQTLHSP